MTLSMSFQFISREITEKRLMQGQFQYDVIEMMEFIFSLFDLDAYSNFKPNVSVVIAYCKSCILFGPHLYK